MDQDGYVGPSDDIGAESRMKSKYNLDMESLFGFPVISLCSKNIQKK
jgi:hypothetical protein